MNKGELLAIKCQPGTPLPWGRGHEAIGVTGPRSCFGAYLPNDFVQDPVVVAHPNMPGSNIPVVWAIVSTSSTDYAQRRVAYEELKRDTAYIAHTANAYPRLVTALKKSGDEHGKNCGIRGDDGQVWFKEHRCDCGLIERRTLLRELGEE